MFHHIISMVRARGAAVGLTAAALALTGCPSMNTYTTARTIPQGTIQHMVALEGLGGSVRGVTAVVPTLPTYQLRYGLTDRIDIAGRISNLTSVGADVKFNLLRGASTSRSTRAFSSRTWARSRPRRATPRWASCTSTSR